MKVSHFLSDHRPYIVGQTLVWNILTQARGPMPQRSSNNAFEAHESIDSYVLRMKSILEHITHLCQRYDIKHIFLQEAPSDREILADSLQEMLASFGHDVFIHQCKSSPQLLTLSLEPLEIEYCDEHDRQVLYATKDGRLLAHVHCSFSRIRDNLPVYCERWQGWLDQGASIMGDFNMPLTDIPVHAWTWSGLPSQFGSIDGVLAPGAQRVCDLAEVNCW